MKIPAHIFRTTRVTTDGVTVTVAEALLDVAKAQRRAFGRLIADRYMTVPEAEHVAQCLQVPTS